MDSLSPSWALTSARTSSKPSNTIELHSRALCRYWTWTDRSGLPLPGITLRAFFSPVELDFLGGGGGQPGCRFVGVGSEAGLRHWLECHFFLLLCSTQASNCPSTSSKFLSRNSRTLAYFGVEQVRWRVTSY